MSWEPCRWYWDEENKKCKRWDDGRRVCPYGMVRETCKGWYVYEEEFVEKKLVPDEYEIEEEERKEEEEE